MPSLSQGAIRLFRAFGINVYLHWSWFILLAVAIRAPLFSSLAWSLVTLVTVFGIVLMHEFGHALACRSVGGKTDLIMLWPLGGVAYVEAPPRPGAVLWSIVAGPLVNVALIPVTILVYFAAWRWVPGVSWNIKLWALWTLRLNLVMLCFNMLPIYPLDGGQTLQAILWFRIGRARSLRIVAAIGFIVAAAACGWAITTGDVMLVLMSLFIAVRAAEGYRFARLMTRMKAAGERIEE